MSVAFLLMAICLENLTLLHLVLVSTVQSCLFLQKPRSKYAFRTVRKILCRRFQIFWNRENFVLIYNSSRKDRYFDSCASAIVNVVI